MAVIGHHAPYCLVRKSHICEEGGAHLFLVFIDELEKQLFFQKKLMKLANKRRKNFNIYIVFKKKEKRKIPRDIIISHLSHLIYSS